MATRYDSVPVKIHFTEAYRLQAISLSPEVIELVAENIALKREIERLRALLNMTERAQDDANDTTDG